MTMAESMSDLQQDSLYWQRLLRAAGYYNGCIDGIIGISTQLGAERWAEETERYRVEIGIFDERTERIISTLLPEAQKAARQWLKLVRTEADVRGYEVKIICGTRTYAEQDFLYKQCPKVTNARGGQSWHNFGLAWDFGIFQEGKYFGDHSLYAFLGEFYRQIDGLEWGGSWPCLRDTPHLQWSKGRRISEVRQRFER